MCALAALVVATAGQAVAATFVVDPGQSHYTLTAEFLDASIAYQLTAVVPGQQRRLV